MFTAVFYSLSNVCQYLTLYSLLVLCHYVHCCLLQSVQCLSVTHTVQSVGSVSLCPLESSTVFPKSVSTSHCTVSLFCETTSTAVFYNLSKVCQYHTIYSLLGMGHYVHCCLLQSVHGLSVPHTVQYVASVSLCPLLSSRVFPLSVSTSHCTVSWFCVTMPTAVFYILSNVCQYHTIYSLFGLGHYVHCCLLHSVQSLSVPHTVLSLLLCQYDDCCLLQYFHCLSVTHTVQSVGSVLL